MTTHPYPELIAVTREGPTVTLTCLRQDGSTSTLYIAAPVRYGFDAKMREPIRLLTLYPEGQMPIGFWIAADRLERFGQTLTAPLPPIPLRADCDHCGAPDALLRRRTAQTAEHLCPECMRHDALGAAAIEHLELLIDQVVVAWKQDWPEEAGVGIAELLNQIGYRLEEKQSQETDGSAARIPR